MIQVSPCFLLFCILAAALAAGPIMVFFLLGGRLVGAMFSRLSRWIRGYGDFIVVPRFVRYAAATAAVGLIGFGFFQLVTHTKLVPCHSEEKTALNGHRSNPAVLACLSRLTVER